MTPRRGRGLIIAAPASGSGKTVITLGLLRALKNKGTDIGSLKIGPDYIDPAFHSYATGLPCRNVDIWSMRPETLHQQISSIGTALMIAEGVMGLFDGAADGTGSTADAAAPAAGRGAGYRCERTERICRRRGGRLRPAPRRCHRGRRRFQSRQRRTAPENAGSGHSSHRHSLPGVRSPVIELDLPSRHLGLVQAREHSDVHSWVARVAAIVGNAVDLRQAREPSRGAPSGNTKAGPCVAALARPAHCRRSGRCLCLRLSSYLRGMEISRRVDHIFLTIGR